KASKPEQFETASDFEHMVYQSGGGTGLTSNRSFYMKASRDLGRALSNPALYNPANAYAPPGVPFTFFAQSAATRCANPLVISSFYNRAYNPDGSKPVITVCDGNDSSRLGLGVFDPTIAETDPVDVLLAVDLNGNGKRDSGEPIVSTA